MAKKRAESEPMPLPAEPKTRPVRLDLPADVHRLLRLVAADDDVSMAAWARDALEEKLRVEVKKRGIKG